MLRSVNQRVGVLGAAGLACASLAAMLPGCGKKEAPPPPPPPVYVPPPEPEPIDVAALAQSLGADARVEFPQSQAPVDRSLGEGVVKLCDALARGDAAGMRALLDPSARSVLDSLEASEGWLEGTRGLEAVRVVYIDPPAREAEQAESADVMLALQDSRGAYVLRWKASRVLDSWVFAGMQATSRERSRASEWDGLELASFEGDGAAPSIPPEVMAQLQALGIDLANPDAASLRAALASIRDKLPPEVLQALEALLAQLEQGGGADSDTAPGDEPPEDEPSDGPSDTTRKRTRSGPVDEPTRGPDGG